MKLPENRKIVVCDSLHGIQPQLKNDVSLPDFLEHKWETEERSEDFEISDEETDEEIDMLNEEDSVQRV